MFMLHFILKKLPLRKQVAYVQKNALYLGTRNSENRKPHLYTLGSKLMAEIFFEEDDLNKKPERLVWLPGLQHLENHLEREFKSSTF